MSSTKMAAILSRGDELKTADDVFSVLYDSEGTISKYMR